MVVSQGAGVVRLFMRGCTVGKDIAWPVVVLAVLHAHSPKLPRGIR